MAATAAPRKEQSKSPPRILEAYVGLEHGGPANGLLTLFLSGRLSQAEVTVLIDAAQEEENVVRMNRRLIHLHFGHSGSFDALRTDAWVDTVRYFLREGFWCTLEMKAPAVSLLAKTGLFRQSRFIPLIRVMLPRALDAGYNAVLEVDDAISGKAWALDLTAALNHRATQFNLTPTELVLVRTTIEGRDETQADD